MFHSGPIRPGTRGGQGDFTWAEVSADKDRENYLGHSINAPTGRWQKNKDVHWYNRDADKSEEDKREEIRKIKQAEEDAIAVALGFKPTPRDGGESSSTGNPNAIPIKSKDDEAAAEAKRVAKEEKHRLKEEKRAAKEERRARRERERMEDDHRSSRHHRDHHSSYSREHRDEPRTRRHDSPPGQSGRYSRSPDRSHARRDRDMHSRSPRSPPRRDYRSSRRSRSPHRSRSPPLRRREEEHGAFRGRHPEDDDKTSPRRRS